jgi:hypothetical protein
VRSEFVTLHILGLVDPHGALDGPLVVVQQDGSYFWESGDLDNSR